MEMERHEVPTVFIRGHADPSDVAYVEAALCVALRSAPPLQYTVLIIDATTPHAVVEVEAGSLGGALEARGEADTVRRACDACIGAFVDQLSDAPATALPA